MNIDKTPMLTDLRVLDPERDTSLDVRSDSQALATLDGILNSSTEGQPNSESERKLTPAGSARPRRRASYLVGAAAGVAALAIGITTFGPNTPDAFASWTPTPQNVAPDNQSDIATKCGGFLMTSSGSDIDDPARVNALDNVISEQRGDFISAAMVDRTPGSEAIGFCISPLEGLGQPALVTASFQVTGDEVKDPGEAIRRELGPKELALVSSQSLAVAFGDTVFEESPPLGTPHEGGIRTVEADQAAFDAMEADLPPHATTYVGRLGSDVTAISITLTDGTEVEANINDGWWTAWWPTDLGSPKEVKATTPTGTQVVDL